MARRDVEYRDPEKPFEFGISMARCRFLGWLYERVSGGFDLYFCLLNSDVGNLPQEKFNRLYDQADDNQEVFLVHLPDQKLGRAVEKRAKEFLRQWLEGQLGSG